MHQEIIKGFESLTPILPVVPMLGAVILKLEGGLMVHQIAVKRFGRTGRKLDKKVSVSVNDEKNEVIVPTGGHADIYYSPSSVDKISVEDNAPEKVNGVNKQHGYAVISHKGQDGSIRWMRDTLQVTDDILTKYLHPFGEQSSKIPREIHLLDTEFRQKNPYNQDGMFAERVKRLLSNAFENPKQWVDRQEKKGNDRSLLEVALVDPWKLQSFIEADVKQRVINQMKAKDADHKFSSEQWEEIIDFMLSAGQI